MPTGGPNQFSVSPLLSAAKYTLRSLRRSVDEKPGEPCDGADDPTGADGDPASRLRAGLEPVDPRVGIRRVGARARRTRSNRPASKTAIGLAVDAHRLLDAVDEQLQRARIDLRELSPAATRVGAA